MKNLTLVICISIGALCLVSAQEESITVATWNLEHLDGNNRGGFGGCGTGFKRRTSESLEKIASLIKELELDIVAIQEVKVTVEPDGSSSNQDLSMIESSLGVDWHSYVAKKHKTVGIYSTGAGNEQVAFLYNSKKVRLDTIFEIVYPAIRIQDSDVHDRHPLVGKFTIIKNGKDMNDFVLINLHLASGQPKKENKSAGMAMIYSDVMKLIISSPYWKDSKESNDYEDDIVFLGDFNHNPYEEQTKHGDGIHSLLTNTNRTANPGYVNLVKENMEFTRANTKFSSLIDHIYVSKGMQEYLKNDRAEIYIPFDTKKCKFYAKWRNIYSDHLPVYFEVKIK